MTAGDDELRSVAVADSVVDRAAAELLRLIDGGTLHPGEKLPAEPELARQLGVGRSTVREAKQVLLGKGFLESRGKVGTYVADVTSRSLPLDLLHTLLTKDRIHELHQARNILEVGAIQLACENATDEELDALDEQLDRLSEVELDREFWAGTVAFHEQVVSACHNATVTYMYTALAAAMRADQLPLHVTQNDRREGVALHRRLVSALRTRNASAAGAAMTEHLQRSHHHDMAVLQDG